MTPTQFRKHALAVPGALEGAHQGHADFRLRGKVFATLGYPDATAAMVKLTPEQQQAFVEAHPNVFHPCPGAWGQRGSTAVRLAAARVAVVRPALATAAQNLAAHHPRDFRP